MQGDVQRFISIGETLGRYCRRRRQFGDDNYSIDIHTPKEEEKACNETCLSHLPGSHNDYHSNDPF